MHDTMAEASNRPTVEAIKDAYNNLFNSGHSLSKLRDAALGDRLFTSSAGATGVAGRSIAWKLFLGQNEPLQTPSGSGLASPLDSLRASRKDYTDMLLEKMRAPDGSYEEGFTIPGSSASPKRTKKVAGNLEKNNPLSLHNENPWTDWFASVELRRTILQDVERTFPEIGYFRDFDVQYQLTNILFLHSVTNPEIGYRQGMHELLAPLYHAVDYDSISEDGHGLDDPSIREMCSRTWVAADAWILFESIMRGVSPWYEWREIPPESRISPSPLATHVHLNIPDGKVGDKTAYVTPIVKACDHIQSTLLRSVDPLLHRHMQAAGIEPQIYGIRWLRLLFTREFSMHDAMILWDGLFACDPTFELTQWVCVAMLVRVRNDLLVSDYSGQLTVLLRYPSPTPVGSGFEGSPHHASLLLRQALALQMSPTPSTGASMVIENRNLLNIPIEVPDPPTASPRRRAGQVSISEGRPSGDSGSSRGGHARQQSSQHMGLPEIIARGLLERGESLGINKTLMSAVSELRRNIPDLAASLVRSPNSASASYAAFPLSDERPPEERPPWEPRTRFEMEQDISAFRSTNKQLGQAVSWIVDILLQDESGVDDPQRLKNIQNKKREALESLSYVRDVLNGSVTEIEEERLLGEEEYNRRKLQAQQETGLKGKAPGINARVEIPQPAAPAPDSRPAMSSSRSSRSSRARSPPIPTSPWSPSTPSAPSPAFTPNLGSTRFAPWNYTRSNFSGTTTLPTTTLPRPPPPTSTSLRPPPTAASSWKSGDQSPPRSETHRDPLGALPLG